MTTIPVGIKVIKKDKLSELLVQILSLPEFCDKQVVQIWRIVKLLEKIRSDTTFVVEYPYVDKHYRDSYYFYHSSKLEKLARDCIRVHVFDYPITEHQIFSFDEKMNVEKSYLGFFIVRPLIRFPLGRSVLSPKAFIENDFICCLTRVRVCLFGHKMYAIGFPHVAQDTETHTCAESSLWNILEYYGTKYTQYRPLLPSQILESLSTKTIHRQLPSEGLAVQELANGLNANGHPCLIYAVSKKESFELTNRELMLMSIYIESGIPLIVALQNEASGHAVTAIGHRFMPSSQEILQKNEDRVWFDVSENRRSLVFIDDNLPPYAIADIYNPVSNYPDQSFAGMKITSYLVPLQRHMHLAAGPCYELIKRIFDDGQVGLEQYGTSWVTRLLLTGGHSFKEFVLRDPLLNDSLRKFLLSMSLPKFIWCCEVFRPEGYREERSSGLVLIDATGSNSLSSVLLYWLEGRQFIHDGSTWLEIRPILDYVMGTYRNNLKGEWNSWQS